MKRTIPRLAGLVAAGLVATGCTAPATPAVTPDAPATASVTPTAAPASAAPSASPAPSSTPSETPRPSASATPTAAPTPSVHPTDSPKAGKATGPVTDEPFVVQGIPVVSKDHRLAASYEPPWADRPNGLHPDVTAAFKELQAGAKADGLTLTIRSGYRSYATQKASFNNAMREYPEKTARLYFAEAGASEHQTGLALDAWDGKNRGTAFARTKHAAWLAEHAHEYGFIVRYPQDKTHITGYAWESWHLRWVGTEISSQFGPNSSLTLEEFLGLA